MANNVTIPAQGVGDSTPIVATEQIATAHYQKIKLFDATPASTNALVVSAAGAAKVDGSAVTQPVSDNSTAWTASFGVGSAAVTITGNVATPVTDIPTVGQKIVVDDIIISTDTQQNIALTEETSGTLIAKGYFAANTGFNQVTPRDKLKLFTANKRLIATCSAASHNTVVTVLWHSEA